MKNLVQAIHDTPHRCVVAITGGGAEAIGELLRYGNGSKTLLEAIVPYDQAAFDDFVRGRPDKYCSPGAARDLAMAAYQRAVKISDKTNIFGVGATSSLVKEGEREGRQHFAYIATQTVNRTTTWEIELRPGKNREGEEKHVAARIIDAIAYGAGIEQEQLDPIDHFQYSRYEKFATEGDLALILGTTSTFAEDFQSPISPFLLCGSFNPIHERHLDMARVVSEKFNCKVDLELCIRNVDKAPLNYEDIHARRNSVKTAKASRPYIGNLHLTTLPTFADKATAFPGTTFIVGFDTIKRVGQVKYCNDRISQLNEAVEFIKNAGCRFLVFHRIVDGIASTDQDMVRYLPPTLREICTTFPADLLPPCEMSSSALRKGKL